MSRIFLLLIALGVVPLAIGAIRLRRAPTHRAWPGVGSVLLCTLAFNLTFFWQELWLVLPKAATPGLHPVLYHNDHSWTGHSPIVELLQGTGAIATLASGSAALGLLALLQTCGPTWRTFVFWMAFQGLFQGLSQVALGSLLSGNDFGRALAYLGVGPVGKGGCLAAATVAMALAGLCLSRLRPALTSNAGPRTAAGFAIAMLITMALSVALCIPFREPRAAVEVVLVPVLIDTIGMGWLVFGVSVTPGREPLEAHGAGVRWPATALILLLLVFQFGLRQGVPF